MMQVPADTGTISSPDTVQTPGVNETNCTVSPVDAVAPEANVPDPTPFVPGLLKVIVCAPAAFAPVIVYGFVEKSSPSYTQN